MTKSVLYKIGIGMLVILLIPILVYGLDSIVTIIFNLGKYFGNFLRGLYELVC